MFQQKYCDVKLRTDVWCALEGVVDSEADVAGRCGLVEGRSGSTQLAACAVVMLARFQYRPTVPCWFDAPTKDCA
jgi:hypothetical protein